MLASAAATDRNSAMMMPDDHEHTVRIAAAFGAGRKTAVHEPMDAHEGRVLHLRPI
jgi:hypothetical protein